MSQRAESRQLSPSTLQGLRAATVGYKYNAVLTHRDLAQQAGTLGSCPAHSPPHCLAWVHRGAHAPLDLSPGPAKRGANKSRGLDEPPLGGRGCWGEHVLASWAPT